ncbi:MAG: hypothetical protein HS115_14385 [Spirochaetales bacterium]|nr:hypothetical protein [Spirochaetales bacterium]
MENVNWPRWHRLAGLMLTLLAAGIAVYSVIQSLYFFWNTCHSRDVLNWDANIRYVITFDQWQDIKAGRWTAALAVFFEGSTWPPLYSFFTLVLFFAWPGGPHPVLAVVPAFLFFVALFPSAFYMALRLTDKLWKASLIFLVFSVFLVHTRELQAYALSGMLETMGMFFLLWTLYFTGRSFEAPDARSTRIGLLLSGSGLFLTKYPFGIMLLFAWVLLLCVTRPAMIRDFIVFLWDHYLRAAGPVQKAYRLALPVLTALALVTLLGMGMVGAGAINKKIYKYIIYVFSFLFFLDLMLFLWRQKGHLPVERPLYQQFRLSFLPGLVWIFLHPDRFSGVIGGQFWIIKQTSSFFKSLAMDVFSHSVLFLFLLLLAFASFLLNFFLSRSKNNNRIAPFFQRVDVWLTLLIFLQILVQEIFSPNKQHRHIYYLIPSVLFFTGYWLINLNLLQRNVILRSLLVLFVLFTTATQLWAAGGLLLDYGSRHFCYAGRDPGRYEPVRALAENLKVDGRYILINRLHLAAPGELSLATEVDVVFRNRITPAGFIENDARRIKLWDPRASELLYVDKDCSDRNAIDQELVAMVQAKTGGRTIVFQREASALGHCLRVYSLKTNSGESPL